MMKKPTVLILLLVLAMAAVLVAQNPPGGYNSPQLGGAQLGSANTWTALQTFSAGISASGVTNSTGIQLFNTATTCTTAATISTPCTTAAITLPVGYADTNYRLSISCLGVTAFPQVQTYTKSNTTFTITLNNLTAAAATCSSFDIIASHN